MALTANSDLKKTCDGTSCPASKRANIDRTNTLVLSANVLTGVAAAGIAAGIILFFVEPGIGGGEGVTVAPSAMRDGGGVMIEGRF
ncbi:MAG: hypothetical protein PHU25_17100 [Deltaproteobacteria bacterium]|nr:hypothetical protein [Deltaproteobacteria bacterium]